MIKCDKDKIWLEYIPNLFCNLDLIPLDGMTLAEQMNALSRLVFVIFLIMVLFSVKNSLLFLILGLLFIIILYYIQKKQIEMSKSENFTKQAVPKQPVPKPILKPAQKPGMVNTGLMNTGPMNTINMTTKLEYNKGDNTAQQRVFMSPSTPNGFGLQMLKNGSVTFNDPNSKTFCNDYKPLDGLKGTFNNPEYTSLSQKLAGKQNPRTLIPPVIVPPIADLEYWGTNNLVSFPQINRESNIDVYRSGYQVSTCCPGTYHDRKITPVVNGEVIDTSKEEVVQEGYIRNTAHSGYTSQSMGDMPGCKSCSGFPRMTGDNPVANNKPGVNIGNVHINLPYLKRPEVEQDEYPRPNMPGQVNENCGYNPEQYYIAGLPTNLAVGNCVKDPAMKQYNKNLFTQTIQPGVYSYNQVNEPINSNIGISFQQQFEPTTCKSNIQTGEVMYTEHDPRIMEPIEPGINVEQYRSINESNVYDPRFSGYGTSYRSYTDDTVGQPRFYYDDVDSIRMPNYVVRSNIDNQPFSDQYGPVQHEYGNEYHKDIRALANDAFTRSAIGFRTDLQERLTRKIRAEAWQKRAAPISTGGQRMLGGQGRIF